MSAKITVGLPAMSAIWLPAYSTVDPGVRFSRHASRFVFYLLILPLQETTVANAEEEAVRG